MNWKKCTFKFFFFHQEKIDTKKKVKKIVLQFINYNSW